jgi:hypothetical protein
MDLPFLIFFGAWFVLFGFDLGGRSGLIFPGIFGWVMLLIALVRVLSILRHRRSFVPKYVSRRDYARLWAFCGLIFLSMTSAELFVVYGMPASWKDAFVKALHVRRVYWNYGPSP